VHCPLPPARFSASLLPAIRWSDALSPFLASLLLRLGRVEQVEFAQSTPRLPCALLFPTISRGFASISPCWGNEVERERKINPRCKYRIVGI
jgi:hypothetical protein